MPLDAPFRLGPFLVDTQGRMEPGDPDRFPTFHLQWRGYVVHARLDTRDAADAAKGRVVFTASLGRVPSTAGGDAARNAARRARVFGALRGMECATHDGWQISLLADHSVTIAAPRELELPASAVDLVTQVTCFLLDLAPYLDWLEEMELAVAPEAGTTKT